jgi:SAM-dependent methyltransferase
MRSLVGILRRALGRAPAPAGGAPDLEVKARESGDPFKAADYFALAEPSIDWLWTTLIWPMIRGADFTCVVDLAAGHGRNSVKLAEVASEIVVVDINEECLEACRRRFAGDPRFRYVRTDGSSLAGIEDRSVTLVYSFDSMVHFHPDVVRAYLRECARVLRSGGTGFLHHSNYLGNPQGDFRQSPHWRHYMSAALFAEACQAAGLEVLEQRVIDWGSGDDLVPGLDCLTRFRRP